MEAEKLSEREPLSLTAKVLLISIPSLWGVVALTWSIAFYQGMYAGPLFQVCSTLIVPFWLLLGITQLLAMISLSLSRQWVWLVPAIMSGMAFLYITWAMWP